MAMAQARVSTSITAPRNDRCSRVYNGKRSIRFVDVHPGAIEVTKRHLAAAILATAIALSAACGKGYSPSAAQSPLVPTRTYSTNFPATESSISEGGNWTNTVSATWNNPVSTVGGSPGHAVGLNSTGFNDSIAMLT